MMPPTSCFRETSSRTTRSYTRLNCLRNSRRYASLSAVRLSCASSCGTDRSFRTQVHLNYRLHTFAGTHRLSAILVLLHSICDHGPTILTSFFGSWEARPPLYVSDLVAVLPEAVLAWQAVRYSAVKQEEEEEE